jgi:uncharacterized membrane protein YqjE
MTDPDRRGAAENLQDRPTGELVQQMSELVSRLVREEIGLAQAELREKGKRAGLGAGLFGGGSLVGLYGLGAVVTALVLLLAEAMEPWLAALIVGVVLLAIAGVLALVAKRQLSRAAPPVPQEAVQSVKQDVQTVKERARR